MIQFLTTSIALSCLVERMKKKKKFNHFKWSYIRRSGMSKQQKQFLYCCYGQFKKHFNHQEIAEITYQWMVVECYEPSQVKMLFNTSFLVNALIMFFLYLSCHVAVALNSTCFFFFSWWYQLKICRHNFSICWLVPYVWKYIKYFQKKKKKFRSLPFALAPKVSTCFFPFVLYTKLFSCVLCCISSSSHKPKPEKPFNDINLPKKLFCFIARVSYKE